MKITHGIHTEWLEEKGHPSGLRLGRHLALDGRSLDYAVENNPDEMKRPIQPVEWPAPIPILDQNRPWLGQDGALGSCTGNAGTRLTAFLHGTRLADVKLNGKGLFPNDSIADEDFAVELYHEASQDDEVQGEYPPDDTGSTGLGVMRALRAAGLITRYEWATSLQGLAVLMQRGPICIGAPWFEAWFEPDSDGFVDTGGPDAWGDIAGGHEFYGVALVKWDERNPANTILEFDNSWTDTWGDHGRGRMRGSTYETLKDQIDIKTGFVA